MNDNVRPLFAENQFAPNHDAIATYLEQVAARIREGKFPVTRGVLVTMDNSQPGVAVLPFGATTDTMQLIGLLEVGKLRAAL